LASIKAIIEGITLNKVHFLILIEVNPSFSKQQQFIYYIYQIGQENPLIKVYILCNTISYIKVEILNKHEFKKTAINKILNIDMNKLGSSKELLMEIF
jgi:hypothetical protein